MALQTAGQLVSRLPLERLIAKPPDNRERIEELRQILSGAETKSVPPPEPEAEEEAPQEELALLEPRKQPKTHLAPPSGNISTEVTVDYQNREIGKLLLRMERHYAQRLRINGVPCDCGSQKHLLDMESLCEETIPMVDNPDVYYRIITWVKEVGPKSTDEAAKSLRYDEEYPIFSHQARDFRKEVIGSLEVKDLWPKKPGEPAGARIIPVASTEEIEQIKEKAHEKIEEVLP